MKWQLATMKFGFALAAIGAMLAVPWPYYVTCECLVQYRDAAVVYVDAAGSVRELHVKPGEQVRAGDRLMTLSNLDMRMMLERLQGEYRLRETRLVSHQQRALAGDEGAARELDGIRSSLTSLKQQIDRAEEDQIGRAHV